MAGKANEARRQLLEERQDIATLQLTANDHLPGSINAVHLKDRLGDVETDCRDRLHVLLLRIVGALTAPTSMALTCRGRSRPQHQYRADGRTDQLRIGKRSELHEPHSIGIPIEKASAHLD